jgi:putative addiction module component (TIGR02574 family)
MSISMAELFKEALDLDEKDRATLAGLLISSLEPSPDEGLEDAWRAEIARRASELDAGSVEAISWDELRDKILKRIDGQ